MQRFLPRRPWGPDLLAFLFDTDVSMAWCALRLGVVSFVPSVFVGALLGLSGVLTDENAPDFGGLEASPAALVTLAVILGPMFETLMLAFFLWGLSFITRRRVPLALMSMGIWAVLHSLSAAPWGLTIAWPFFVFSCAYLAWRDVAWWRGFVMASSIHALQNLLGVAGILLGGQVPPPDVAATRPNIVVIMADDMGYSDIGPYGGEIDTPNLDELARDGIRFSHFYNTARCWTTRASLLTGLYPHQVGLGGNISGVNQPLREPGPTQGYLDPGAPTIAEALGAAGYATYMAGKWHVGERPEHWPRQRGFDRYFGLISGASSYFEIIRDQPRVRQMALDDAPWDPPEDDFYMTDAITDYAVRYVEDHAASSSEEPFFLYVAYTAPHWPLHALPDDIAKYDEAYAQGWDATREERLARMNELGLIDERYALSPRPPQIPPFVDVDDADDWVRRMQVYAAMVDRLDQGIGRIRDALRAADADDNTLILFLADNGGSAENVSGRNLNDPNVPIGVQGSFAAYRAPWANVSNTPFRRYKSWMYEGGIASPLIAHWPAGIADPGRISARVGHVVDIFATSVALAGAPRAPTDSIDALPLEGRSFARVLAGQPGEEHDAVYWEHLGHRAMRRGDWKIVYAPVNKAWELYDLSVDPTELEDLAATRSDILDPMVEAWEVWARRVGAASSGG